MLEERELDEPEYNFNIDTYSIEDLYKWFNLNIKDKEKYTEGQIETQEFKMRNQLIKTIGKEYTNEIINFLHSAKEIIIALLPKKKPFTTIQQYRDNSSYPAIVKMDSKRENELISEPIHNVVYVQNDNFATGKLNPITHRTITKYLDIDSRFRDNDKITTASDFQIILQNKFRKVVSMQLSSIELPITFYGISKHYGNNHFFITIEYSETGLPPFIVMEKKIVIEDGNYSGQDLIELINNLLSPRDENNEPLNQNDYFGYVSFFLSLTNSGSGTGKLTVSTSGSKASSINSIKLDFSKDFNGYTNKNTILQRIGINFGFKNFIYDGQTTYIAESIFDPATIRYLYLVVDDFQHSSNESFISAFPEKKNMNSNILARITLKGMYFTILTDNDYKIITEPRKYFGAVDLQKLRIQLLDDLGRTIDLNGCNYSFCLNLQMLYE